ncbi:hypothetical protein TVAG_436990 [Trichomonas vaginalis G3]|uniref:Uncharacterized protein n=1 Tax=Trichomonas vaginalis (strain ATCC PRA-98 / G3) TaxID=412133 RepID=A2DFE7_TRIV3|nr:hypothetical protein TVAGG3_0565160 [Trichomonas vaginalis G3]EAY20875.1 hypothetical protein TVAG_436990 [Trichomonas vaginalis G3]KAI5521515.1 hypothetical protein TVAGG3_0565160 [Trichomonas vaginalis G3]|eukprot:XP_001581861.1 hypothetical protein [Trichomonas vaginalis G3]
MNSLERLNTKTSRAPTINFEDIPYVEVQMPKTPRTYRPRNYFKFGTSAPQYTIKLRRPISDRTATSDIDIPDIRKIGGKKQKISDTDRGLFYIPTEGPDVIYTPRVAHTAKGGRISLRIPEKPNENPGPGAYSPKYDQPKYLTTLSRSQSNELWRANDTPGPGSYNIAPPIRKFKHWYRRCTAPPVENIIY